MLPIFWLTGNTGAGKTTLAESVEHHFNWELSTDHPAARRVIVLDGDDMRATISTAESLSKEDRTIHNLRVARLAAHLQSRGFLVLVAVIAPFAHVRKEIDDLCHPQWIHIKRSGLEAIDRPYEEPEEHTFTVDHDTLNQEEAFALLLAHIFKMIDA